MIIMELKYLLFALLLLGFVNAAWVYQETPDIISTSGSGVNPTYGYDGDWGTYGRCSGSANLTYDLFYAVNSSWPPILQLKWGGFNGDLSGLVIENITLDYNRRYNNTHYGIKIVSECVGTNMYIYYQSTGTVGSYLSYPIKNYTTSGSIKYGDIYEEAIYWNDESENVSPSGTKIFTDEFDSYTDYVQVHGFEDWEGAWTGISTTYTNNTAIYKEGWQSLNFTGISSGWRHVHKNHTTYDLSGYANISAWIYKNDSMNTESILLDFGNGSQSTSFRCFINNVSLPIAGWNFINIPRSSCTVSAGSPSWTTINYTYIGFRTSSNDSNMAIDNIRFINSLNDFDDRFMAVNGVWEVQNRSGNLVLAQQNSYDMKLRVNISNVTFVEWAYYINNGTNAGYDGFVLADYGYTKALRTIQGINATIPVYFNGTPYQVSNCPTQGWCYQRAYLNGTSVRYWQKNDTSGWIKKIDVAIPSGYDYFYLWGSSTQPTISQKQSGWFDNVTVYNSSVFALDIDLAYPNTGTYYADLIPFRINVDSNPFPVVSAYYTLDGAFYNYTPNVMSSLSVDCGRHTLFIVAVNSVGNTSSTSFSFTQTFCGGSSGNKRINSYNATNLFEVVQQFNNTSIFGVKNPIIFWFLVGLAAISFIMVAGSFSTRLISSSMICFFVSGLAFLGGLLDMDLAIMFLIVTLIGVLMKSLTSD